MHLRLILIAIAAVSYALQILMLVHAIKTGRDTFWIVFLLFIPIMAGVLYVIVLLIPEWKERRAERRARRNAERKERRAFSKNRSFD